MFIGCAALPGITEESWSEENKRAVDQFIVDTTIKILTVYVDPNGRLRVEHSLPSSVQHTFLHTFNPKILILMSLIYNYLHDPVRERCVNTSVYTAEKQPP